MKILLLIVGALVLLAISLVFVFSLLAGKAIVAGIESIGPEVTKTTVELDSADLSMLSGKGSIRGLIVGNPDGFNSDHLMKLGEFTVDLAPASLLSDKIIVEELVIERPELIYETTLRGTNFGTLLENVEAYVGEEEEEASESKRFEVKRIALLGAKVTIAASPLGKEGLVLNLPPIEVTGIGAGAEGVTLGNLVKRIVVALDRETLKALGKSGGDVREQLDEGAEKVKERIGGLLNGLKRDE